jgi:SRSO17 transposase
VTEGAAKVRVDEAGYGWDANEEGGVVARGEEAWEAWTEKLGRCFGRIEIRARAQYRLNRAQWRSEEVRKAGRAYVIECRGTAQGVRVVDETGFLKKGRHSAGVQRQDTGTAGKVENCQLGGFLAYTRERGHALIDRELYVPKSWAEEATRCQAVGIPEATGLATPPPRAQRRLERSFEAGIGVCWVTADEG